MATFSDGRYFLVLLWLIFCLFCKETVGDTVHIMAVTPTPFGASLPDASFSCLLSDPDTDQLNTIKNNERYVLRGTMFPLNTSSLPGGTTHYSRPSFNMHSVILPINHEAQGMFFCEASKGAVTTRVPVTILAHDRRFQPSAGQFTVTANIGDSSVVLALDIVSTPGDLSENKKIIWQKQGQAVGDFETYRESSTRLFSISPVTVEDAGVYATYWEGQRQEFRFSLIRLIVRACIRGRWGPPSCTGICDNCYNGGICDDKTGECVCRPGFTGPNCLTDCGENKFGWDCAHQCGINLAVSDCSGSLFCMPDPVGCSCMAGYTGAECDKSCSPGKFGAGCTEDCNCAAETCDRFTGMCDGPCSAGWSGISCQIPDTCEQDYFGDACTSKCHCLNGAACDRETGKCDPDSSTGLSLCEPGYVSSTGINLDNCQDYEGCYGYADCTKTCHCSENSECDSMTGACSAGCNQAWSGLFCQAGVLELTYEKTNPGQPMNVTCIVTGDPETLNNNQVQLLYDDGIVNNRQANPAQADHRGHFVVLQYELNPIVVSLYCILSITVEGQMMSPYSTINTEYYDLPELSPSPFAGNINATSVEILWNVWNSSAGDTGDGPVIAYNVYANSVLTVENLDGQTPSNMLSVVVGSLTPSTTYQFYVTAIREGTGGEGPPSPYVTVTTLPMTTQPSTTITTIKSLTTSEPTTAEIPVISTEMTTTKVSTKLEKTSVNGATSIDTSNSGTSQKMVTESSSPDVPVTQSPTAEATPMPKPSSQQGSIIVAVILSLVFVLVFIIALIWLLRRRRKQQPKRYPPSLVASEADLDRLSSVFPDSGSVLETHPISNFGSIDNLGFDDSDEKLENRSRPQSQPLPVSPDSTPALRRRPLSTGVSTASIIKKMTIPAVNIKDYAEYVKTKRQGTDLVVEWESLPKNLARPTTIAKKSEHKGKNRYKNVVAYDHSRVVLDPLEDDPNSDYVNACYIKGIKNPKAYIAAQGPNDITVGDLWRMVWQENISVMVMACNVIEEGKLKCTKYWPEKDAPVITNGITIVWNSEEQKEEYYIIRRFTISKEGEGARELLHFHYTSWPDKDVPKHCTPVLKFIKDINENHDRKAPLLIHCSAGAGRTGTIIAIYGMMDLAEQKNQVDIYNFVFSMRNSRPNMVQTDDQYIFVHDAILEYLFCKDTFIEVSMFASRLKSLHQQNPETGRTFLEDEYEIVNLTSPNFGPEKIRGSTNPDGVSKIRSGDSIPADSSRPYLMTERGDDDRSPYINAAYMDGYKKKDLFISTQMPMANTVVDLWRMMYDYNCTSIVMLNAMDPEDEDCPQFWPDAGTSDFGPFTVTLLEHESLEDFEMRTLQLVYTKRDVKSPIPVRHFQYMTWPKDDERPATSHGILQLISSVEKWQKTLPEPGPIVVLCMNAAGRSGAFCTIQTALDQVREEQGVDVLQIVKQLRIHRTNVVDTPTKYLFCYEAILEYLKAFDDYSGKKPYQNVPDFNKQKEEENEEMNHLYGNIPSTGVLNSATTAIAGGKSTPSGGSADIKHPSDIKPFAKEKPKSSAESGTPRSNRRGGKKPPQKTTTSNQEQLYQNVMFDTEL